MASRDDFFNLFNTGYRRLVPIIPPDAAISPQSSLARRPKALGKTPGIKGFDGLWRGFDWLKHETTESDLDTWAAMGAGIGMRTGAGLVGIDVDTKNGALCETIAAVITRRFGSGSVRIGDAPKFLVLFQLDGEAPYQRVEFDDGGSKPARVEVLTEGRQFVAVGTHPGTRRAYLWPLGIKQRHELPVITRQQLSAFFEELADVLPAAHRPVVEAEAKDAPPQHTLRGDPEAVRKAVSVLPNTVDLFPTYDDYVRTGAAIKASLPDDPQEALQLFLQWAARWEGGDFNAEVATADWNRIKPPYKVGANWLYRQADRYVPDAFSIAEVFFAPITTDIDTSEDLFTQADKAERERTAQEARIAWIDPKEWSGREPQPRSWIVDGLIPAAEVTLLTGKGGVGKTLLAQQISTAVSAGLPVFGCATKQERVLLFLCEDDENELHRRQRDINAGLCLSLDDLAGNMRISSRKHHDNLLVLFDRSGGGRMTRTPLWHQLMRTIVEYQPGLVVIDTIADVFGGSEIDRQQVRQFVQGGLGAFAQATGCAVLALGHPSRAGESSGEGTSGSTAWHASVRSRLYLRHADKNERGAFRKLETKKSNYGPSGSEWTLRWERGAFTAHAATVTGTPATQGEAGQTVGEGGVPDTAASIEAAVLYAVAEAANRGVASALAKNSPNYAPKVLQPMFYDMLGMYDIPAIGSVIETLVADGKLAVGEVGRMPNRHPKYGLRIVVPQSSESPEKDPESGHDVFD